MTRQIEITEAIHYIQTHLYDHITLDKLASHVFHFNYQINDELSSAGKKEQSKRNMNIMTV